MAARTAYKLTLELLESSLKLLAQDAHGVQVVEFAGFEEAAAQDAFRPEPCAHVRGDCAAVVASHLERHALEVEAAECVREDGADGNAAEPAARDAKQHAEFTPPRRIKEVSECEAADEFSVGCSHDCLRKVGRIMAGAIMQCRLRLDG